MSNSFLLKIHIFSQTYSHNLFIYFFEKQINYKSFIGKTNQPKYDSCLKLDSIINKIKYM